MTVKKISPVLVVDRPGTRLYPSIVAQGPGRVGLAWYETNATSYPPHATPNSCPDDTPENATWFIRYAFSGNATDASPIFVDSPIQAAPVHVGQLGHPFAEVLQLRSTSDGRAYLSYAADVSQGQGRPMFAMQMSPP